MICMEHRSNTEFIRVSSNLAYTLNFIKLHVFTLFTQQKCVKSVYGTQRKCVRKIVNKIEPLYDINMRRK